VNGASPLASGLIGCFLFNEGAGTTLNNLASAGAGPFTANANFAWGAGQGQYGGPAGLFNGSNADCVAAAFPAVGPAISILVGIFSSNYSQNGMMVEREGVNSTWEFFMESASLRWRGASGTDRADVAVSGPLNNLWHQLGVTDDGTSNPQLVWIDGASFNASGVASAAPASNTNPVHFGTFDGSGYALNGIIDYIYIWNRALSSLEMASLFADPFSFFGSPVTPSTTIFVQDCPAVQFYPIGSPV
jgi:hypothetical protein